MQIIYSTTDPAGTNIIESIKNITETPVKIIKTEESLLYSDELVNKLDNDFVVFASKHKSESGKPSFTVHVPGNWGKAEMGGKDNQISFSDPIKMKAIITTVNEKVKKGGITVEVTLEVNHHGPLCMKPCSFVEIGSSEKEWKNKEYSRIIAESILEYEDMIDDLEVKEIAIGVGGGHYCPAFNKHQIDGKIAFAHIIPKYSIDQLKYETFIQCFERTTEEIETVYIDWKGLNQDQRKKIIEFSNGYGIGFKRI